MVGNSGSGKTLFARRLAQALGVPHIELDAIHHLPAWEPIDPDLFLSEVETLTTAEGWVIDGNYRTVVVDGPVWPHNRGPHTARADVYDKNVPGRHWTITPSGNDDGRRDTHRPRPGR